VLGFQNRCKNLGHRHCERSEESTGAVIPGWCAASDRRCAIAHRGISRFSDVQLHIIVRCSASPRNDSSWIAHMGNVYVKDAQSPFCSTAATSSSRPRALQDDARRSSQGRPFRGAAQRLGLELIEHVIMLGASGTIGAPRVGGSVRASVILAVAIQGSSRFGDLGCLPDQTHIRSSREATAPQFRLRRAGSRGRNHSSLRRLKPCNPSVRRPGSSKADRASADRLVMVVS
jgi:hypothetical protein